jgi:hypothetical protein
MNSSWHCDLLLGQSEGTNSGSGQTNNFKTKSILCTLCSGNQSISWNILHNPVVRRERTSEAKHKSITNYCATALLEMRTDTLLWRTDFYKKYQPVKAVRWWWDRHSPLNIYFGNTGDDWKFLEQARKPPGFWDMRDFQRKNLGCKPVQRVASSMYLATYAVTTPTLKSWGTSLCNVWRPAGV